MANKKNQSCPFNLLQASTGISNDDSESQESQSLADITEIDDQYVQQCVASSSGNCQSTDISSIFNSTCLLKLSPLQSQVANVKQLIANPLTHKKAPLTSSPLTHKATPI